MPRGIYDHSNIVPWNKGRPMSEEQRMKLVIAWKRRQPFSKETRKKMSESHKKIKITWGKSISKAKMGEKNPNWKGGITPERLRIWRSEAYKLWRKTVFERDNYTCIFCNQKGGKLNADHIKPFSLYPLLRFSVQNGRTLCVPCHQKTPTYGGNSQKNSHEKYAQKILEVLES